MAARMVHCPRCGEAYPPPAGLVPGKAMGVRCPSCSHRFQLRLGFPAEAEAPAPTPAPEELPPVVESSEPPGEPEPLRESEPPAEPKLSKSQRRRRARRLARALVHGLLSGQQGRRDRALHDGRLLLEFGEEIRRAWKTYTERVGRETARETPYFKDALNEILAGGTRLF